MYNKKGGGRFKKKKRKGGGYYKKEVGCRFLREYGKKRAKNGIFRLFFKLHTLINVDQKSYRRWRPGGVITKGFWVDSFCKICSDRCLEHCNQAIDSIITDFFHET